MDLDLDLAVAAVIDLDLAVAAVIDLDLAVAAVILIIESDEITSINVHD